MSHGSDPALNVLVVDDEPDICDVLRIIFEMSGHSIETANSGNDAYAKILKKKPDVLVTDIRMDNGGGVELIEKVDALDLKPRPVIFVISGNDDVHATDLEKLQIDGFLQKPISASGLISAVRKAIGQRQAAS